MKEKDEAKKYVEECPECGEAELNVEEIKDIVDYYVELAEQMGSNVEIISTETEEGAQFYNAFRGLGALLRFRPK